VRVLLINTYSPANSGPECIGIRLAGKRSYMPPLGLLTVAALLPQHWPMQLVDLTFEKVSEAHWANSDLVLVSGTMIQFQSILDTIQEAKRRGKIVVVGGPAVFHFPDPALEAGADLVVRGEAEVTIPALLEHLAKREFKKLIENVAPADITQSPVPRFDLLNLDAYCDLTVQLSRGCPFQCEFCDVTLMFGREIRVKTPKQMIQELQALYELGWRRHIFFADDNFVGRPARTKAFLQELIPWMEDRGYPFEFSTFASVNLGKFTELQDLMVRAGFVRVWLGIETTDRVSLKISKKVHNAAVDIDAMCEAITRSGLQILALIMVGFDGEEPGRDRRVIDFVRRNNLAEVEVSLLQAFPGTRFWDRLKREGRLLATEADLIGDWNSLATNFVPTRPMADVFREFVRIYEAVFEPEDYLRRAYRHIEEMDPIPYEEPFKFPYVEELATIFRLTVRQGLMKPFRWTWWKLALKALLRFPNQRFAMFIRLCIILEDHAAARDLLVAHLKTMEEVPPAEMRKVQATAGGV
jgi:radical SAM superfamily enzyme YgiQ (UPF0313 family)